MRTSFFRRALSIQVVLLSMISSSLLATGYTVEHVSCRSATESFGFYTYSTSPPGGPVTKWSTFEYSRDGEHLSIPLQMPHQGVLSSFNGKPIMILTALDMPVSGGKISPPKQGYVHIYANAVTKDIFLDVSSGEYEQANTHGLRKIEGMSCKINYVPVNL